MKKGVFTISIDYEFGWGRPERLFSSEEAEIVRNEVHITRRLLDLFEEYSMPATWAVASHLLESSCSFGKTFAHPEYPRPITKGKDWFFQHPPKGDVHDVLWFDSESLISRIAASPARHEIASHSYAHIAYGAPDVNPDAVKVDIQHAKSRHSNAKLPFQTFIFPWNSEGFYAELYEAGIMCYRGTTARWYHSLPGMVKRVGHVLDYVLPFAPPVVMPTMHASGLLNIADSMLLLRREGIRKWVPSFMLKTKAVKGLQRAVSEKAIFHLWFHPFNFAFHTEEQFAIFEHILREAYMLRNEGKLDVHTMSHLATTGKNIYE
jgi:hypothetical protein